MELLLLLISTIRRNILVDSSIYLFAHILSPISITFFTYKFLTLDYVYFFLNFTGVSNFGWGNIGIIYKKRKKKKELFSINTMIVIQSNQRIFFEKKREREGEKRKKERRNFTIVHRSRAVEGVLPGNACRLTKLKIIAFRVRGRVKFHRIIWPTNIYALHSRCNKF